VSDGLPPNPSRFGRNIDQWALALYEYMTSQTKFGEANDPVPLLPAHLVTGGLERASVNGIVLYDPVEKNLVISKDGLFISSSNEVGAPASASASGVAGTWSKDADYFYACTATDTWKRVAISTW
jgi:hypothetical protein